jgi:hypothetical protein
MKERATYDDAYRLFTSIKVDWRYRDRRNGMTGDERELLLRLARTALVITFGAGLIAEEDEQTIRSLIERIDGDDQC